MLVDQSDTVNASVLPPAATRQLLGYYQFAWVGLRLDGGARGIPALQRHLAELATRVTRQVNLATGVRESGLTFDIRNSAVIEEQVQQAIRPQAAALAIFAAFAFLAMLVLVGQGMSQLASRAMSDISAMRALGATRAQQMLVAGTAEPASHRRDHPDRGGGRHRPLAARAGGPGPAVRPGTRIQR